jgi:ParB-like nuclease domain
MPGLRGGKDAKMQRKSKLTLRNRKMKSKVSVPKVVWVKEKAGEFLTKTLQEREQDARKAGKTAKPASTLHDDLVGIGYRKVPSRFGTHKVYYRDTPIAHPANTEALTKSLYKHGFKFQDTNPPSWDNGRATVSIHKDSDWRKHRLHVDDPDDTSKDFEWSPVEDVPKKAAPMSEKEAKRHYNKVITLSRLELLASLAQLENAVSLSQAVSAALEKKKKLVRIRDHNVNDVGHNRFPLPLSGAGSSPTKFAKYLNSLPLQHLPMNHKIFRGTNWKDYKDSPQMPSVMRGITKGRIPPGVVTHEKTRGKSVGGMVLDDGHHRLAAAKKAGFTHFPVRIVPGDYSEHFGRSGLKNKEKAKFSPQNYLDKLRGDYKDMDERQKREATNKMQQQEAIIQNKEHNQKRSPLETATDEMSGAHDTLTSHGWKRVAPPKTPAYEHWTYKHPNHPGHTIVAYPAYQTNSGRAKFNHFPSVRDSKKFAEVMGRAKGGTPRKGGRLTDLANHLTNFHAQFPGRSK